MKRKTHYKTRISRNKPVPVQEPVEPVVPEPEPVSEVEFKGVLPPMQLKPPVRWYHYEGIY